MTYALSAKPRTSMGKRSKDELAIMRVPAVMYGSGVANQAISVPRSEFIKVYRQAGYSSLVDITIEGAQSVKAVIKEIQFDPLTVEPRHVDFHQVRMDQEMEAKIPLVFTGESSAVKVDAGTLIKSLDEVEVRCLPADLPHELTIDLSKLATFDDSITVADIKLPKGVELVTSPEMTIATVARPLTEDELKKLEEGTVADVSQIKTEAEEKKAAEDAKKAEEATLEEGKK